jgi:hypothetical protein
MCKQLFCLRPSTESFRDKKVTVLFVRDHENLPTGGERRKVRAHRILENLLNLLFDTIEFSNNNFKRFFPGFSRVRTQLVLLLLTPERSQIRYLGSKYQFQICHCCNKIKFKLLFGCSLPLVSLFLDVISIKMLRLRECE